MKRIQRRRVKGWRMPPGAVIVDRTTPWGNPYVVGRTGTQAKCVDLHNILIFRGGICISCHGIDGVDLRGHLRWVRSHIHLLVGKVLACWCRADQPCHADNLAELATITEDERVARACVSRQRYARQRLAESA